MDVPGTNRMIRRSTRSFVEDESDADLRELQQPAVPADISPSSLGSQSSQPADAMAHSGLQPGLSIRTNVEPNSESPGGTTSSGASTASSSYSSILSSPSSADVGAAVDSQLNEDSLPELEGDDVPTVAPGAPVNFGFVMPGLFRSSYPKPENYDFLRQLGLKTIVTLVDKKYTEEYRDFIAENGIQHHTFAMKGTKKEDIPIATMEAILSLVLDRRNYPMLIHCNQGRHRTGCVVAVLRKIAGWDPAAVADEYRAYAGRKVRECDVAYIRAFDLASIEKLLARDDLNIDQLVVNSRIGGPMVGRPPPPPTTVGFRVPNFFRTTFFSMTVLFIWIISGSKMPPSIRR